MSKDYPTIAETEAYDRGFTDAEDYWRPKEQERIIKMLEDNHYENTWEHYPKKWVYMENCMACNAIALINGED